MLVCISRLHNVALFSSSVFLTEKQMVPMNPPRITGKTQLFGGRAAVEGGAVGSRCAAAEPAYFQYT